MPPLLADLFSNLNSAFGSVGRFVSDGGLFMLLLLALSLLAVTIVVLKALDLRAGGIAPEPVQRTLEGAVEAGAAGELGRLRGELRAHPSALSRIAAEAMSPAHGDRAAAAEASEVRAREEVVAMEKGIAMLEVVITIAPLLGLLGTVSGLVGVFGNLDASPGADQHGEVARGIAEALYTTIAGISVAVPAVIAHSYFSKKVERLGVRMEVLVTGLLGARFGGGGAPPAPEPRRARAAAPPQGLPTAQRPSPPEQ